MPRRTICKEVEVEVRVSINDFEDEDILEAAAKIRGHSAWYDDTTGGQDYGPMNLNFSSWDALRLREALDLGDAHTVLDIVRSCLRESRIAA